jgi:hypothetical protein
MDFFWPVKPAAQALSWFERQMPAQHDVYGKPVYLTPDPSTYDHWGQAAGFGAATQAVEHVGDHVAEDRGSQKAIKGLFKSFGFKTSNKAIGRAGAFGAKAAPLAHIGLAVRAGYKEYSACMAE